MLGVVILAIIQGIAEFLPISSSAHLLIFRDLFGIGSDLVNGDLELIFDIALHFGTMLAIIIFFFKDFLNMAIKGLTKGTKDKDGKLLWYIIVATIPAAIMGVLFEDKIESVVRSNFIIIGSALIFMGIIIYLCDKYFSEKKDLNSLSVKDAIIIGCSQVFALIPGFSRSGTTISSSRCLGISREDSAKFSFYLSLPVVMGAVLLSLIKDNNISLIIENLNVFVVGVGISFISGLICIKFLLKYIKKHDFKIFMWYRIALGLIVIICSIIR